MSDDAADGPLMAALDSVYFASLPAEGGMIYPWEAYESWLREAARAVGTHTARLLDTARHHRRHQVSPDSMSPVDDLTGVAPSGSPLPADVPVAELLNGYIGSHILYALITTGVLETLHDSAGPLPLPRLASATNAVERVLRPLLRSADRLSLVRYDDAAGTVTLTSAGREAYRVRGYFTASVGGFGEVFQHLGELVTGADELGSSIQQNHRLTALGCAQNWAFQQPIFDRAIADLEFTKVADMGCGAALRLIHLVETFPGTTGIASTSARTYAGSPGRTSRRPVSRTGSPSSARTCSTWWPPPRSIPRSWKPTW